MTNTTPSADSEEHTVLWTGTVIGERGEPRITIEMGRTRVAVMSIPDDGSELELANIICERFNAYHKDQQTIAEQDIEISAMKERERKLTNQLISGSVMVRHESHEVLDNDRKRTMRHWVKATDDLIKQLEEDND